MLGQPLKATQSQLSIRPERLNAIDMPSTTYSKLIRTMVNSVMFFITHIYQSIIGSPAISMNNAIQIHMVPNHC